MNDQNYRGTSRANQYEGRNQGEGRGSSWNRENESSRFERGNSPRGGSASRDQRSQGFQGPSDRWGHSGNDEDRYYTDSAYDDADREYTGSGRDYGRDRGGSRGELSGFGAQGRYGNWDTSGDRDPYRSESWSGSRQGSSYGPNARANYGSREPGQYGGSGAYGSGTSGRFGTPVGSGSFGGGYGSYGAGSRSSGGSSYGGAGASGESSGSGVYRASGSSYSGRGPKGYTRSDDRIREDVCEQLSQNDEVDASDIEVQVKDRQVTLTGTVETRRMKHLAEDIAEAVSGVEDVENRVTVRKTLLRDIADRVTGNEGEQHYSNTGTKNNPAAGTSSNTTGGLQSANGRS